MDGSYSLSDDIVYRVVEGEAIILDVSKGTHFSLNKTATEILSCIDKKETMDSLLNYQMRKYCEDKETLKADITDCIKDLLRKNILVRSQ